MCNRILVTHAWSCYQTKGSLKPLQVPAYLKYMPARTICLRSPTSVSYLYSAIVWCIVHNIYYVQGVQHWIWKLLRGERIGHVGSSEQINSLYVLVRPPFRENATRRDMNNLILGIGLKRFEKSGNQFSTQRNCTELVFVCYAMGSGT